MWAFIDDDETKGTVNGGSFHGAGGAFDIPFVNIFISGNKFVGEGKYGISAYLSEKLLQDRCLSDKV